VRMRHSLDAGTQVAQGAVYKFGFVKAFASGIALVHAFASSKICNLDAAPFYALVNKLYLQRKIEDDVRTG